MTQNKLHRLNAICPYFTMFPLEFPLTALKDAQPGDWVLDPYCGRGTTNFAGRLLGLPTLGIDSSPVAVATAQAKLIHVAPRSIVHMASRILREVPEPRELPNGAFWKRAYAPAVLRDVCRLRQGLMTQRQSRSRTALRGLLLGALHGPMKTNGTSSYFSNQSPRTYAPKPQYALNFWLNRDMQPPNVNVLDIIAERAERYYGAELQTTAGRVILGDSRHCQRIQRLAAARQVRWVVTSPPYYGMRTYIPDQWLRNWFMGGPAVVDYSMSGQLSHRNPQVFAEQMRHIWRNVGAICETEAHLVIRFGGIVDRQTNPMTILMSSLEGSGWHFVSAHSAGSAAQGRRQADTFLRNNNGTVEEHDVWASWRGV